MDLSNQEHDEIRSKLRLLREDPPDDGFRASLHRRLVAAGSPQPLDLPTRIWEFIYERPIFTGATVGLVTAVAVFVLLHSSMLSVASVEQSDEENRPSSSAVIEPAPKDIIVHRVPFEKVAVINLHFSAEVSVEDVDFKVSLPQGLSFFSQGETLPMRSFSWKAPLQRGDNPISIAVRGHRPGRYLVQASATVDGEVLMHDVVLELREGV